MDYKEEALEFLGVTRWHELGYKGQGIKIMSGEKIWEKEFPNVISPKGFKNSLSHGDTVMRYIYLVAPEAIHIAYPLNISTKNGEYQSECVKYIMDNKIEVFTVSKSSGDPNSKAKEKALQDCIDSGATLFTAAGNSWGVNTNEDTAISGSSQSEKIYAIGGVKPKLKNPNCNPGKEIWDFNNLTKVPYSSEGKELDFVTLGEILGDSGTSFCAPVFSAMCVLVQQFFREKTGRTLIRNELELFIRDYLIDLEDIGFDVKTGHGLFILPKELSSINIQRYVPEYSKPTYIDYSGFPEVGEMKIQQMLLTPSKYTRPQTKIKPTAIAWHYTGNPNTSAINNRNYFESLKDSKKDSNGNYIYASSHFIIGLEGEILQLIPEDEKSHCTNQANDYTISVECCHPDSTGEFTDATYKSMLWLGKYLMAKHNIRDNIRHYDVTGKICPKWFVDKPKEWEKFKERLVDGIMLNEIISKLGITEEQFKQALIDSVSPKIDKDKRPGWMDDELYEAIKKAKISDMTRLNDTATRAEVATMVYNATK